MRLPIQYALEYPRRFPGASRRMDWNRLVTMELIPPDLERFPALKLGFEAAQAGGSAGVVLNAANEAAVSLFLAGELHFTEIVPAAASVLGAHHHSASPTLDELRKLDEWAR